ncbi:chemotaxis protein CheB [Candidatus Enterovibrio escicola]
MNIVQDEKSAVVWGMPKVVIELEAVQCVFPWKTLQIT